MGGLPPGVRSRKTTSVVWKAFNEAPPPLPRLGTLRTRRSGEIAASSWSVGCECLDRDYANFEMYKTFLPDLGVKWAMAVLLLAPYRALIPRLGVWQPAGAAPAAPAVHAGRA